MSARAENEARVLLIYTGGTIGMEHTLRGLAPAPGVLRTQLRQLATFYDPNEEDLVLPALGQGRRIRMEMFEYTPLLDSSNMSLQDWARIARDIEAHADRFDGFVVLHGTDTMSYTASALSFMLENLHKPVVLTGSQMPLHAIRNDATNNLLGALTIAGNCNIPEVGLFFRSRLYRGNRTQKVDTGLRSLRVAQLRAACRDGLPDGGVLVACAPHARTSAQRAPDHRAERGRASTVSGHHQRVCREYPSGSFARMRLGVIWFRERP